MKKFLMLFCLVCICTISCPFMASAATINVPANQPTIQAGIDAAVDGDTVLVADGTYTGEGNRDIDFNGKAITVKSENGAGNCIVDCEWGPDGFNVGGEEGKNSILSGFTVTKSSWSAAIRCGNSSKIMDCIITNNSGAFGGGYGISAWGTSTITGCTISNNLYTGITLSGDSTITDCTISNNGGIGINAWGTSTITGCTISNNGGGISCSGTSTITGCTISNNERTGISCSSGTPTITGSIISGNQNRGIDCTSSSPTITGCTISGNLTAQSGGGLYFYSCIAPIITNCLIIGNTAYENAGAIWIQSSAPIITNCTISGNIASFCDGIYVYSGLPVVRNTIIYPETSEFRSTSITYSDIAGYSGTGEGNIDEDPLFVGGGDYRLSASSPCIDTGTSSGAPDTDLDGNPRPQGGGYDMGAYEYMESGSPVLPNIKANGSNAPITVSAGTPVSIDISLDPGDELGLNAEWWIVVQWQVAGTLWNSYSYVHPDGWFPGITPCIVTPLMNLGSTNLLTTTLPPNDYEFFFVLDDKVDGVPEIKWMDSVKVQVQ